MVSGRAGYELGAEGQSNFLASLLLFISPSPFEYEDGVMNELKLGSRIWFQNKSYRGTKGSGNGQP